MQVSISRFLRYTCFIADGFCRKCELHTSTISRGRARKLSARKEPGLSHLKTLHEDDPELLENLDELDVDADEMDLMKSDLAFDDHERSKNIWRDKVEKKIAIRKFFAPAKQPLMLTYNEKLCIKYLHKEDPIQWNVHTLSESFPATPETIHKILRSKYKVKEHEIKKMDARVQQNWKLLEEGKLDASPEVLEHLKKFLNRREVLLEQIKTSNFYLPEVKKEKVWNNGEMNNILKSYEKSIAYLGNKNFKENKKQLTSGEIKPLEVQAVSIQEKQSDLNNLCEKINKQEMKINLKRKESFVLGEMCKNFSNPVTYDNLKENILHNLDAKKKLSSVERVISEDTLSKKETVNLNYKQNKINEKDQETERRSSKGNDKTLPKSLFTKETSVLIEDELDAPINKRADIVKKLQKNFPHLTKEEILRTPLPDSNTTLISEVNISKNLNRSTVELEPVKKEKASRLRFEEFVKNEPERLERDKLYYERESKEIKNTAFWNNRNNSSTKALLEFEKRPVGEPKDIDKITPANINPVDKYPERIKIPRSKRGSGLIFKVKDCYYDDDGEFLYRVPGMVN